MSEVDQLPRIRGPYGRQRFFEWEQRDQKRLRRRLQIFLAYNPLSDDNIA